MPSAMPITNIEVPETATKKIEGAPVNSQLAGIAYCPEPCFAPTARTRPMFQRVNKDKSTASPIAW